MIEKIGHYSITGAPSVYDEEALTALELAARTAGKVNEAVDAFNNLEANTNAHLKKQDADIPVKVEEAVKEHIELGSFDEQINEYIGDLDGRVENLLGSVQEGSTNLDAEVIDGRFGADGVTYSNLGTALREQFKNSIGWRTAAVKDANAITETGFYFIGSADNWANVPDTAGVLVVLYGGVKTRLYQLFISHIGATIHARSHNGSAFKEWHCMERELDDILNEFNNNTLKLRLDLQLGNESDVNNIISTGFYPFGSSTPIDNLPEGVVAGILIVYKTTNPSIKYQQLFSYSGDLYVRTTQNGMKWTRLGAAGDSASPGTSPTPSVTAPAAKYTITRGDSEENIYISQRVSNGKVVYKWGLDTDLEIFRIMSCTFIGDNGISRVIFNVGHDIDGVIKYQGAYYGGVHGYESADNTPILYIDGKQYTYEDFSEGELNLTADTIHISCDSMIMTFDGPEGVEDWGFEISRNKHIVFDEDGLHIYNSWADNFVSNKVDHISGSMFSVNKDIINLL